MATVQHGDEALAVLRRLCEAHAGGLVKLDGSIASLVPDAAAVLESVRAFEAECEANLAERRAAIMREIL